MSNDERKTMRVAVFIVGRVTPHGVKRAGSGDPAYRKFNGYGRLQAALHAAC